MPLPGLEYTTDQLRQQVLGKAAGALHCSSGFPEPISSFHPSLSAGASGVGRSHIKNALLSNNPDKFMYPPPCKYPGQRHRTRFL